MRLLSRAASLAVATITLAAPSALLAQRAGALGPNAVRTGFATTAYGGNDDGSWPCVSTLNATPPNCAPQRLSLPFDVNFFGHTYNSVYLNNNGNLTFDAPLATYTPFNLYTAGRVMIAPFFADVDTRDGGNVVQYGETAVDGRPAFAVTWPGVGCFQSNITSALDDFQVVLINRDDRGAGDFDIEFNYDRITWDTGTASGGNTSCRTVNGGSARVGYSNGQQANSFELPGSGTPDAFLDGASQRALTTHRLNSPQLGRYLFTVRNGLPPLQSDQTAPELQVPGTITAEATSPAGAAVTYAVTATDPDDDASALSIQCSPASGSTFAIGTTTVQCTASDPAGNSSSKSFDVRVVDTTAPVLTVPSSVTVAATSASGAPATFSVTATDAASPPAVVNCDHASGADYAIGTTTVTCTATDQAGNVGSASFPVRVLYRWDGFRQPINDTAHQVGQQISVFKAGSTVPVKLELKTADGTAVTSSSLPVFLTPERGGATTAAVDESVYTDPGTTGSAFRYVDGQYVYNWDTAKSQAGYWWRIFVLLPDGTTQYVTIGLR